MALALLSASACRDENDPVLSQPDPGPAYSTSQAGSLAQTLSGCDGAAPLRTIQANPSNYRSLIAGLIPGDRLMLAAGTYGHLPLHDKHGQPGNCIVIEGPASGSPAQFLGSDSWNIISLRNASYIALRNLSLDGLNKAGNGIKAEFGAVSVHHVLVEGLNFKNFSATQGVAISTKAPAWNWVVRQTTIIDAYTGMYFGGSEGELAMTNFLVEHNLVYRTLGYNVQFKHQHARDVSIGIPSSGTTIIRHNTFSKGSNSLTGDLARPNLLVGHWPLSGTGALDTYQVYGNLFYENPSEALFQGEGNIALHDNLFVNSTETAVRIRPHNGAPRNVDVFNNTVVSDDDGITITGGETGYTRRVVGNAVFALRPITLVGGQPMDNVTGTQAQAATYLNNPTAALGSGLDLYPKAGQLQGTAIDHSVFSGLVDWDRDFNGRARVSTYRGAYSGDGVNPGWAPALAIKPEPAPVTRPEPAGVLQNGVTVWDLWGAQDSQRFWTIEVPAGGSNLQFKTSAGTGNAGLYVRFGSAPTATAFDCRPSLADNNETCTFASPAAGTWHVLVQGDGPYSGVTLVGSYQTAPQSAELQNGVAVTGLSGGQDSERFWTITVPAGATNLTFQTSDGSGDADLFVRYGSAPTLSTYDCGPVNSDNAEWCSFPSPAAGTWHVMVHGYLPYSGATLVARYDAGCTAVAEAEPNGPTSPQPLSGSCSQVSGTFVNETSTNDYFRVSVPAGKTLTGVLNGLSADYHLFLRDAAGTVVANSMNSGTAAEQVTYTNGGTTAVNIDVQVWRNSSAAATYQLRLSY